MDFGVAGGAGGSEEAARRVRVRFTTKLGPPLRVPSAPLAVPSNLTRMGLSEIVNLLLENGSLSPLFSFLFSFAPDRSMDPGAVSPSNESLCLFWWRRVAASAEHETQPFDFLIDGELVRLPLEEFLLAKGISAVRLLSSFSCFPFHFLGGGWACVWISLHHVLCAPGESAWNRVHKGGGTAEAAGSSLAWWLG